MHALLRLSAGLLSLCAVSAPSSTVGCGDGQGGCGVMTNVPLAEGREGGHNDVGTCVASCFPVTGAHAMAGRVYYISVDELRSRGNANGLAAGLKHALAHVAAASTCSMLQSR